MLRSCLQKLRQTLVSRYGPSTGRDRGKENQSSSCNAGDPLGSITSCLLSELRDDPWSNLIHRNLMLSTVYILHICPPVALDLDHADRGGWAFNGANEENECARNMREEDRMTRIDYYHSRIARNPAGDQLQRPPDRTRLIPTSCDFSSNVDADSECLPVLLIASRDNDP